MTKHHYKYYLRYLWAKSMNYCKHGCHQMPERSFYYHDYQFPICARCTGVLVGKAITILFLIGGLVLKLPFAIFCMFIMFFDWFIQFIGLKESNNVRRFLTGILGGIGLWSIGLYVLFTIITCIF